MRKNNLGVLGIILLLSNLAMAGEYKMITDTIYVPQADGITKLEKHAEVCTAFLKNLEALPPFPPMVCELQFKPEFTDFKVPEWKEIDVWDNRDLSLQPQKSEAENEAALATIRMGLAYRTAQFDIDNDGVPDQILEGSRGKCDPTSKKKRDAYQVGYHVYDPATRKLDTKKKAFYDAYWSGGSLFSYKGLTYNAHLYGGFNNGDHFGKLDRPDKHGIRPTKYWIRLYRPIPMNQGIKQPVALGCEYLYLPTKHEGGY
jgi:hypothetical protein